MTQSATEDFQVPPILPWIFVQKRPVPVSISGLAAVLVET
jgi:hypothetical protein